MGETLLRLLDEADASLRDQRERAGALVNKATALIGFTVLAAPLLWRAAPMSSWSSAAVVVAGVSLVAGFYVVIGRRTVVGPSMQQVNELPHQPARAVFAALLGAKDLAFQANEGRMRAVEGAWSIHVTAFVVAGILALLHVRSA